MGLLRLAGFRAVRITSTWEPGLTAPTEHEAAVLANVAAAASLHGVRVYVSVYHAGSRTTPLTPEAQAEFAAYAAAIVQRQPELPRRDRRQRAEPQPLLAAAVQRRRHRRVGARLPRAARGDLRRGQGGARRTTRIWGGALAPRGVDRPGTGRDTISPTRFIRELGRRLPRERPHEAGHGRLRLPPLRRATRASPVDLRADRPRPPRPRRPGQARAAARHRRSTAPRRSAPGCRSSTTSTGSSRSCRRRRRRSTAAPSRRRRARSTSRRRPRPTRRRCRLAYCQSNVAGILLFHAARRARPRRLAVGPLLPGRDAEVVARRRPRHARRDRGRHDRQVPARDPKPVVAFTPAHPYDLAPMRPRLRLPRTARCGCPPARSRRGGTAARAAGSRRRSSSRRASRPGSYRLSVSFVHATRPGKPRRARQRAVSGALALAALTLAGCGGNDDSARPERSPDSSSARSTTPSASPGRRSTSSQTPASARSGSRASGSPVSPRRRRRSSPSSEDVAARAGEPADLPRRLPAGLVDDAADAPRRGRQFASYVAAIVRDVPEIRDVIVGNEPNLNRFWLPQFDEAGSDVAAPAYFALLIEVYDAVEEGRPRTSRSGAARSRRAGSTGRAPAATRTRRRRSSAISAPPSARAAATSRRSTASPSTRTRRARASRPTGRPTRTRRRSCWPTTRRSCGRCWTRRSGPAFPSSTASSASRR